ncbi:glycosyltransferase family 39 protein [Roseospira goensis]|uniref:4-amino-4-deoxy-L-arabinose transferase-like glycosyltransferase n=1 Tax=Roseospira goensis TaxID=391922 RepID=A0A7W6RZT4_9PROT|nr:glycosyltransferase family 39 protein [Roseospira goensis]MBB4285639.1 4-amino-4-deoxy-L-arabinose transferase-like glycosyltransferase [Roseospira goensis]
MTTPPGPVGGPLARAPVRWGLGLALLLLHVALTVGLSTGLARDELESMLFAQGWAWGYDPEQPPLYNWLQMALVEITGPSLAGSILLRWAVIAGGVLALYDAVRRMARGDGALAAGAVTGMAGTALFGFEGARHFTHTTLLLTTLALLLWAMVRVVERPTAPRYLLLGATLAAALLAKYTVAVFALALLAGALADPATRARVLDRRLLWAGVVPLLVLPGHLLWRIGQDMSLADRVATITDRGAETWTTTVPSLLRTVVADPLAAMAPPLLLLALLVLPLRLRQAPSPSPSPAAPRWDRVLLVYVGAAMALTFAIVLAVGGERLRYHYMMPAALVMPAIPLLWAQARGLRLAPWRRSALGWGLAGLAVLFAVGGAIDRVWIEPARCDRCLPLLPTERAAAAVRTAGFRDGTIVAATLDWGANLRLAFPEARMVARHYPDWTPPRAPGEGACLILLSRREAAAVRSGLLDPAPIAATLAAMLDAAPPDDWLARLSVHDLPLSRAPERTVPFGFVLLPEGLGTCR